MRSFDVRPTRANALRVREAYQVWLNATGTFLTRCHACLEFNDEVERYEEMLAGCLEDIEALDQLLEEHDATYESQEAPQQQRNQGQQLHQYVAKAQRSSRTTRRVMRWLKLR